MNEGAAVLRRSLRDQINKAIEKSADAWNEFVEKNRAPGDIEDASAGFPLAVKYVPSKRASDYLRPNNGLYIGSDPDFTWGKAVYVTGVTQPLSTAIYGRVGLVSWFNPKGWKVFDARVPANQRLYMRWLRAQTNYDDAVLTVHSNHWLFKFRNTFREQFGIDVVLCKPDEKDRHGWYTDPDDIWLGVSDWERPGLLAGGSSDQTKNYSRHFRDVRVTIVAEEEFTPDSPALTRSPQLASSKTAPTKPTNVSEAYWRHEIVRVQS